MEGVAKMWEKDEEPTGIGGENGQQIGEWSTLTSAWALTSPSHWGFRNLLISMFGKRNMSIIVYEDGFPVEGEEHMSPNEIINDKPHQKFFDGDIGALCDTVKNHGAIAMGNHCWSLLDNLEWIWGYSPRVDLTYADKTHSFRRIPIYSTRTVKAMEDHTIRGRSCESVHGKDRQGSETSRL
ncbi:hypothetical protein ACJZ2D_010049 [Fusarium nematophilum]